MLSLSLIGSSLCLQGQCLSLNPELSHSATLNHLHSALSEFMISQLVIRSYPQLHVDHWWQKKTDPKGTPAVSAGRNTCCGWPLGAGDQE